MGIGGMGRGMIELLSRRPGQEKETGVCGSKLLRSRACAASKRVGCRNWNVWRHALYVIDANKGQVTRLKIKRIASPYAYEAWNES